MGDILKFLAKGADYQNFANNVTHRCTVCLAFKVIGTRGKVVLTGLKLDIIRYFRRISNIQDFPSLFLWGGFEKFFRLESLFGDVFDGLRNFWDY